MNSARNPRPGPSSRAAPSLGPAMMVLDESGLVPSSPRIGVPCSRPRKPVRAARPSSVGRPAGVAAGHALGKLPDRPNSRAPRSVGPPTCGAIGPTPGDLRNRPNRDARRKVGPHAFGAVSMAPEELRDRPNRRARSRGRDSGLPSHRPDARRAARQTQWRHSSDGRASGVQVRQHGTGRVERGRGYRQLRIVRGTNGPGVRRKLRFEATIPTPTRNREQRHHALRPVHPDPEMALRSEANGDTSLSKMKSYHLRRFTNLGAKSSSMAGRTARRKLVGWGSLRSTHPTPIRPSGNRSTQEQADGGGPPESRGGRRKGRGPRGGGRGGRP